jgi:hypothetical protein
MSVYCLLWQLFITSAPLPLFNVANNENSGHERESALTNTVATIGENRVSATLKGVGGDAEL